MARSDAKLRHLAQVPMFRSCSPRQIERIGQLADTIQVPMNEDVVRQGQSGREFFIVLEGRAAVVRDGVRLATLSIGDHFGELALVDGGRRTATVTAETVMQVACIGQREFFSLLGEVPELARALLLAMTRRLRASEQREDQLRAVGAALA